MEIIGMIHAVQPVKEFNHGFTVEEFYLDISRIDNFTGQKYENYVLLQNTNEKLDLKPFKKGDIVKVKYYINGRPYEKDGRKGFVQNLTAASIELVRKHESNTALPNHKQAQAPTAQSDNPFYSNAQENKPQQPDDDLPF